MPIKVHQIDLLNDATTNFLTPFEWCMELDVSDPIPDEEIDLKFTWLVDPGDSKTDLVMDEMSFGPLTAGLNRFSFDCDPPRWKKIPEEHLLGSTGMLVELIYKDKPFLVISYRVSVYPASGMEDIPETINIKETLRSLDLSSRRITSKLHPLLELPTTGAASPQETTGSPKQQQEGTTPKSGGAAAATATSESPSSSPCQPKKDENSTEKAKGEDPSPSAKKQRTEA